MKDPSISSSEAQFLRRCQKQEKKDSKSDVKPLNSTNQSSVQSPLLVEEIPEEARKLEQVVLQFDDVSSKKEVREGWVHAAEQACNVILPGLPFTQKRIGKSFAKRFTCILSYPLTQKREYIQLQIFFKTCIVPDILKHLVSWVRVGLNFNMALLQPQPGYKIRHIKVGVRLAEILCMCSGALAELLIVNEKIHQRLLRLYHLDCMSLSIRLMILRALDASLRNRFAVEHFLLLQVSVPHVNGLKLADRLKLKEENSKKNKLSLEKPQEPKVQTNENADQSEHVSALVKQEKMEVGEEICIKNNRRDSISPEKIKYDVAQETVKLDTSLVISNEEKLSEDFVKSIVTVSKDKPECGKKENPQHCKRGNFVYKKIIVNENGKKSVRVLKKRVMLNGFQRYTGLNGYQALILMFKAEKLSRTKFALCNLIRKLHFYEVLEKFKSTVKALITTCPDAPQKKKKVIDSMLKSIVDISSVENSSDLELIDTLVACLSEITSIYNQAPLILAQPKRFLPGHAQFDLEACSQEVQRPYPALFSFLHCHSFLECCNVLLTSPQTMSCSTILNPLFNMIKALADSNDGLQFLATHTDATNVLLRILLQQSSSDELLDESTITPSSSQHLGLCIAYRLQALHFIDLILEAVSSGNTDPERHEVFENLLGLYYLSFSNVGQSSLIHVLSRGDFIKTLVNLATHIAPEADVKYRKFPGKNFVDDLMSSIVKLSEDGSFLQQFGVQILKAARNSNSKLQEVVPYLQVVENPQIFSYDDILPLCEIVKRNMDQTASFPGELITALRILRHLAVSSCSLDNCLDSNGNQHFSYLELKHKYVVLELFSLDGVSLMTSLLAKMCEAYEQPALHASAFLGMRGAVITSIILPALELLRHMLTLVIQCRNTDFRDLTAISVLLKTYTLLHAFPSGSLASESAQKGCKEVIETLLAYTQPVQLESLSESEGLNKSLWTLMMAEVLKYVTTNSHTFMSGLLMVSELLPLPLPVQTRVALPAEEVALAMSSRKLWCAHLHSQSSVIGDLISTMCGSSCPPLLQLLRRVCVQLSDLAAPTALVVARSVLDAVSK